MALQDTDLLAAQRGTTTYKVPASDIKTYAAGGVPAASETVQGKVELATAAETTAGTDTTRATHPAGVAAVLAGHVGAADPHAQYALESSLSAVATSGDYNDLLNQPALVTQLDDLSDVDTSTTPPSSGQVLAYNGTTWVNSTPPPGTVTSVFGRGGAVVALEGDYDLDQLGDVDVTTTPPTDGQVLSYSNASGTWVPATVSTSGPPDASETVKGIVELATAAETATGTDNTRAVHPAGLKAQLDLKAPLASPALTGTPTAPTATAGTNTTQLATTAFVTSAVAGVTVPPASETVAGIVELATAAETATGTDNTRAVHPAGLKAQLDLKAPLASPALTGTPTAPTAVQGTDTTQLATTEFVNAAVAAGGGGISDGDKGDITVSNSGNTWTIDSPIQGKTLGSLSETVFAITDAATVDLNPANGPIQTWLVSVTSTVTANTFPAGSSLMLMIAAGSSGITWPTVKWVGNAPPALATTGYSVIEFWKVGTNLYGCKVGDVL